MQDKILDGKGTAEAIKAELSDEIKRLENAAGVTPGLAVVLVGEDPASQVYVNMKEKACKALGIVSRKHLLPVDAPEEELLSVVDGLNADKEIDGILVQLPLPGHIDENKVLDRIKVEKDVDGFPPVSVGRLVLGQTGFRAATPAGIIELLKRSKVDIQGREAVVVGRSNIVGKPVALLLLNENATVTIAHSRTQNLSQVTRRADILVVSAGRKEMITADMVKEDAVVVDVGIHRTEHGLVGDVAFNEVREKASAITPVPGGVGPMTIAMLMSNTVKAARNRAESA